MRNKLFLLFSVLFAVSLSFGCGSSGSGNSNPVATALNPVNSMTGPAQLSFNMVSSPTSSTKPSLRAQSALRVIFELDVVQVGNASMPVATIKKIVPVVGGNAIATFTNLPLKSVVAKISIEGGIASGSKNWRGAIDLKDGKNIMDISPKDSKLKADLMAGVIEELIKNKTEFAKIPFNLVSEIEKTLSGATDVASAFTKFTRRNAAPAFKTVENIIASPTTQVKQALKESLQTAVTGFRLSNRASVVSTNNMPSVVPILGGDDAMNIGALFRVLPNMLSGGGTVAFDGVGIGELPKSVNGSSTLTVEFSSTSVTYQNIDYRYMGTDWALMKPIYATSAITLTTISGVTVTSDTAIASDGKELGAYITGISGSDGMVLKREELDVNSHEITSTLTIKPKGLLFDFDYARTNSFGRIKTGGYENSSFYASEFGIQYYAVGTETFQISFPTSGELKLNVVLEEKGKMPSSGWVSLKGFSGVAKWQESAYVGTNYNRFGQSQAYLYGFSKKTLNTKILDYPTFANNTFTLEAAGSYPEQGFILEDFKLVFPNIQLVGIERIKENIGSAFDYSFSDGYGNVGVVYNGNKPEEFGYISKLKLSLSGLGYDVTSTPQIKDGAQVVATSLNTSNVENMLTYKLIGEKPVLQPVTQKFSGGEETVSVSTEGNTIVQGSVSVKGSDSDADPKTIASMTYNVKKTSVGIITVKVDIELSNKIRTMFFTRDASGNITGKFYLNKKDIDDDIGLLATFTVTSSGAGTMNYTLASGYVHTESFYSSIK